MKIKYQSRVVVTDPGYICASVGATGTILDEGHYSKIVQDYRFLVRWDGSENLYGVHAKSIELISDDVGESIRPITLVSSDVERFERSVEQFRLSVDKLAVVLGMQAENDQRKAAGASMAYTESDFASA